MCVIMLMTTQMIVKETSLKQERQDDETTGERSDTRSAKKVISTVHERD